MKVEKQQTATNSKKAIKHSLPHVRSIKIFYYGSASSDSLELTARTLCTALRREKPANADATDRCELER